MAGFLPPNTDRFLKAVYSTTNHSFIALSKLPTAIETANHLVLHIFPFHVTPEDHTCAEGCGRGVGVRGFAGLSPIVSLLLPVVAPTDILAMLQGGPPAASRFTSQWQQIHSTVPKGSPFMNFSRTTLLSCQVSPSLGSGCSYLEYPKGWSSDSIRPSQKRCLWSLWESPSWSSNDLLMFGKGFP